MSIFTSGKNFWQKINKKKAILIIAVFVFGLLIYITTSYCVAAIKIKNNISEIKTEINNLQKFVVAQNFEQIKQSLAKIKTDTAVIKKQIENLKFLQILPPIKKEVKAGIHILGFVEKLIESCRQLSDIGAELYGDLGISGKTIQQLDFKKLNSNQRGNIMVAIRQATSVIKKIHQEVSNIDGDIKDLTSSPWTQYLDSKTTALISEYPDLKDLFDFATLGLDHLPELIGYYDQANYLILLENNTELRPTGGFIGTYGLADVKDGRLKNFFIDDVYNLDKTVKDKLFITPPWPLEKWNNTSQWFLRDANWSPDFPTSAKQVEWLYLEESDVELPTLEPDGRTLPLPPPREGGVAVPHTSLLGARWRVMVPPADPIASFTAVIAITPDVIAYLLDITGPITVHNITFTKENFIELLEYRVEMEFKDLKIPVSERKAVINALSDELQEKLKKLPLEKMIDLASLVKKKLDEKHILLYFTNNDLEKAVKEKGWAGEIRKTKSDYLMVIDANLGSLKTDAVMDKRIDCEVKSHSNDLIVKVTITYTNNGKFAWNTTRYRTYTRIYVPLGSELIKAEGMMANDRTLKVGEVSTEEEFDKTVFGAFIAIEPKETKTLTFEYKLPDYIKEQYDRGEYDLLIQKQAGTRGHSLKVEVMDKVWETDLSIDRKFSL